MTDQSLGQRVAGHLAERIYGNVLRFRRGWNRYRQPEDLKQLLKLFPNVSLLEGYRLDYLQMGSVESGWIWPYACLESAEGEEGLPEVLAGMHRDQLISLRDTPEARGIAIGTLNSYLRYSSTPLGLFEYAFFMSELWSTKSSAVAGDWLELELIFSRFAFDNLLRKTPYVIKRIKRPDTYDPQTQLESKRGGEVSFLAYRGGAFKHIFVLKANVDPMGSVIRETGDVLVVMD
ncbi:MAG: hypothetical protein GTO18_17465 [Anaerolineales bacterium]|nr:hypothetical protein [Anaerolineales bacterium]